MYNRKNSEAAQRFAERRRREDEASRLRDEVPQLQSLRLEIEERNVEGGVVGAAHIRHVVVERAPATFVMPCGDPHCQDGGHDLTRAVMQSLRSNEARFDGQDACRGSVGTGSCSRIMHFVGIATYA